MPFDLVEGVSDTGKLKTYKYKRREKGDFSTEHNNICFFNHSWIKEKTWTSGGVYVKISSLTQ